MYDLNDAQPQMAPMGDLIPDGAFAPHWAPRSS